MHFLAVVQPGPLLSIENNFDDIYRLFDLEQAYYRMCLRYLWPRLISTTTALPPLMHVLDKQQVDTDGSPTPPASASIPA